MRKLALAVPSRGRPANIARLWAAMQATCTEDTSLIVGVDLDDPCLPEYTEVFNTVASPNFQLMMRPDLRKVTAWTNAIVAKHLDEFSAFGQIGDDNVPRTHGWDTQILDALKQGPFAFGNDLYPRHPGSLCCHVFASSAVPRALGYFGPPSIAHMYVDVAWWAWGVATKITYLHETVLEHMHYTIGKATHDHIYANTYGGTADDLQAWHAYSRSEQLNEDICKIGAVIPFQTVNQFTPEILAQFNRDLNIPEQWGW